MKSYEIKLYSRTGLFKKTINPRNLVSDITFSEEVNGGQSDLNLEIIGDFSDYLCTDIIEIREVDEENKIISPTYTGIIEEISLQEYEDNDIVSLQVLGLATLLNDYLYKTGGNRVFISNLSVGNLIKSIIDSFNTDYGTLTGGDTQTLGSNIISYTPSSIDTSGALVNISYDNDSCLEAIQKAITDTDFSFWIGADGICYVQKESGHTKVSLTKGKHILLVDRKLHKRDMVNTLYLERDGAVEVTYTDPASVIIFGKKEQKVIDSDIIDVTTQNIKGNKYITDYAYERNEISITMKPQKTSSIVPGNMLTINNIKIPIVDKQITKITKSKDSWTLNIGDFISFGSTVIYK